MENRHIVITMAAAEKVGVVGEETLVMMKRLLGDEVDARNDGVEEQGKKRDSPEKSAGPP